MIKLANGNSANLGIIILEENTKEDKLNDFL